MDYSYLNQIISKSEYVEFTEEIKFKNLDIVQIDWKNTYHKRINKLKNAPAVYCFCINNDSEIIYIGAAGKIKNNVDSSNRGIKNRLKASRGKDYYKKDVLTFRLIHEIVTQDKSSIVRYKNISFNSIQDISIHIIYTKLNIPSSYFEALLLKEFYTRKLNLPKLNLSF